MSRVEGTLTRPVRIEFPGAIYHVMSHGVAGTPTFIDDTDRFHFLNSLEELVQLGMLIIHAFVLMINHFHMLCETPLAGLSHHMQNLLGTYAQWFNCRRERKGHLWQGRYKALLVEDGEYFLHCSRYIHLNPVKANICAVPQDYPWSSCGRYFRPNDLFGWVSTARTLNAFSSDSDYRRLLLQGCQEKLKDPFEEAVGGLIFGSRNFVDRMRALVPVRKPFEMMRARELRPKRNIPISAIDKAIEDVFPQLSECQRTRMLVYTLRRFTDKTGREIADITGRSPSAVTHIWQKTEAQLLDDLVLQQQIDAVSLNLTGKLVSPTDKRTCKRRAKAFSSLI
jgi:putative transposase